MIFTVVIGIGNVSIYNMQTIDNPTKQHIRQYSIYQSSIDYTIAAYGVYAASATGGNDFARDFLSGIAAIYSVPMFTNIGHTYSYEYASTILACVAIVVTIPIYVFYHNGPAIRARSPFAQKVMQEMKERRAHVPKQEEGGDRDALQSMRRDTEAAYL